MTPTFDNIVIRASAGTGKTFQLSNRFLGLAAAGQPLDSILATTFTRKAAGEIMDRVLFRLADAALDDRKRSDLAGFIKPDFSESESFALLRRMVGRLHRLRIATLDSFFIQIARTFALELGLPPGWQIIDEIDDQRLRLDAIRDVLTGESTDDVVKLMHLLSKGEVTRSVTEQILMLANQLLGLYQESPEKAWERLKRLKTLEPSEVDTAIEAVAALEMPSHKSFVKGRDQNVQQALTADWLGLTMKGLASKIIAGEESYYRKEITAEMVTAYEPLIEHARAVLLNQIAAQTEATRNLLARFDRTYRRMKFDRRTIRFEDVARLLLDSKVLGDAAMKMMDAKTVNSSGIRRVVFRLDGHVHHLLLDEFQDTSPTQWSVLRPFSQEVTGSATTEHAHTEHIASIQDGVQRSFFCVGDVKQAIYGWRGGVAEIFDTIESELPGLVRSSLNRSFRSSRPVIETVNRVFESLDRNAALDRHCDAAVRWLNRFEPHDTARDELSGYCELVTPPVFELPENESTDDKKPRVTKSQQKLVTLRYAAEQIMRMNLAMPERTIGVLVRKNQTVGRLIALLRRLDVEASEEGGNPLTDSSAVMLILSLLTLADHPGDRTARFHVAHSSLAGPMRLPDHEDRNAALRLSSYLRKTIAAMGYGPAIHQWSGLLATDCDERDVTRLEQLVEQSYAYDQQATERIDDFIHFVRYRKVESPTSARVRVMTVHQSKGLQFDVVVLPELDEDMTGQTPSVVVGRPDPTAAVERICRYVNQDVRRLMPEPFIKMFDDHTRHVVEESLCVLYVAITRAIHGLLMIVPPSTESEKQLPATMAGLLRGALTDGAQAPPESRLFCCGDADWIERLAAEDNAKALRRDEAEAVAESVRRPLEVHLAKRQTEHKGKYTKVRTGRSLNRVAPSQLEGGAAVNLAERLTLTSNEGMQWGTVIHTLMEQVTWLDGDPSGDDMIPGDAVLRHIIQPLVQPGFDIDRAIAHFRQIVSQPTVRQVLSRNGYLDATSPGITLELISERPFVLRQKQTVVRGSIDRLVVLRDEQSRPVRADIIDFKTDVLPGEQPQLDEALVHKTELYRPQLATYRDAVCQMYKLEIHRVTARLLFVGRDVVADV